MQYWQIFCSFLIFCCYFTCLKAREISCKIWDTRKVFPTLHSAPCDNNYLFGFYSGENITDKNFWSVLILVGKIIGRGKILVTSKKLVAFYCFFSPDKLSNEDGETDIATLKLSVNTILRNQYEPQQYVNIHPQKVVVLIEATRLINIQLINQFVLPHLRVLIGPHLFSS